MGWTRKFNKIIELMANTVKMCSTVSEGAEKLIVKTKAFLFTFKSLKLWSWGKREEMMVGCIPLQQRMVAFHSEVFCGFSTFQLAAGSTSVFLLMDIPNVSVIPLHLKRPSPPACSKITALVLKVSVAFQECQYFTRLRRLERFLRWASWKPAAKPAASSSCGKTWVESRLKCRTCLHLN